MKLDGKNLWKAGVGDHWPEPLAPHEVHTDRYGTVRDFGFCPDTTSHFSFIVCRHCQEVTLVGGRCFFCRGEAP